MYTHLSLRHPLQNQVLVGVTIVEGDQPYGWEADASCQEPLIKLLSFFLRPLLLAHLLDHTFHTRYHIPMGCLDVHHAPSFSPANSSLLVGDAGVVHIPSCPAQQYYVTIAISLVVRRQLHGVAKHKQSITVVICCVVMTCCVFIVSLCVFVQILIS